MSAMVLSITRFDEYYQSYTTLMPSRKRPDNFYVDHYLKLFGECHNEIERGRTFLMEHLRCTQHTFSTSLRGVLSVFLK